MDIDDNINISFHIKAIEQSEAIKMEKESKELKEKLDKLNQETDMKN